MTESSVPGAGEKSLDMRRSLVRFLRPLGRFVANRLPGGNMLVKAIFDLATPGAERWVQVHGLPLLTNIHDGGIGATLYLQGGYAAGRVDLIRRLVGAGDIAIDVGANIGYFTVQLADLAGSEGRVYAFEPDPRNFRLLMRTVERNRWSHVTAYQQAVSNQSGEMDLYLTRSWASNTLRPQRRIPATRVEVVSLDEALPEIEDVRFVKIDVDGSEARVIEGMAGMIRRSPRLVVLAEYEPGNLRRYLDSPTDLVDIAEANGLKLSAIASTDTGPLPGADRSVLDRVPEHRNLDLVFSSGTCSGCDDDS